jgi:hypothetical protein
MHFGTKSYLKSNCYHTAKHPLDPQENNLIIKKNINYFVHLIFSR